MRRADFDIDLVATETPGDDLLALDEALARLESQWPDKAKLVKLRYFAGLTIPEASRVLKISTATAERHWRFARAWLHSQLHASE
jgi:DNA-directed RNA polymerase specialized sigma24 family protein